MRGGKSCMRIIYARRLAAGTIKVSNLAVTIAFNLSIGTSRVLGVANMKIRAQTQKNLLIIPSNASAEKIIS